ncbi:hypothetical protein [Actinocrispum sp. NPDC049592]|uniref:hypothetical protein n=1 Tax=Actinocrispum sp. NPDC049592 TaxID=3154835 RepID=UPI00341A23F0
MHPLTANETFRLRFWSRVREFAVPPTMIESATARRMAGDWAGACAAAHFDVDLDLRAVGRAHGREFAARVRADLRQLAPDLLRWHFPRIAPDGLLRPDLTVSLARYRADKEAIHLVARTPPVWADAGQRISLALWEPSQSRPHPDRRFRLDLHRHLWDAPRAGELAERAREGPSAVEIPGCATHRWMAEAALLLQADGCAGSTVAVRLSSRRRLMLDVDTRKITVAPARGRPLLPDAATWLLPDVELLRAGLIDADRLHPLVAAALCPGHRPAGVARSPGSAEERLVECRGAMHRIGVVNGVLVPLDHDADEIRREELLIALGGTGPPCLQAIDTAHRAPENLADVRARLDHGDTAGALAVVERLLGADALLRSGALRDELETALRRKVSHGMYRAGIGGYSPPPSTRDKRRPDSRAHPRHATRI